MKDARQFEAFSEADDNVIDITAITKSSLTAQYSQEKEKIINEFGSLEQMRSKLGLTKSKIAQLLLVKPATWSRWEKRQEKAPPHIFQAVKWYLLLAESNPDLRKNLVPEFTYENHLKMIGTELKKMKVGFDKTDFMSEFEGKVSNMIAHGLSQVQYKIQAPQNSGVDESFKSEQYRIQSKIENVEYLVRQMKEDISNMNVKLREPVHYQSQKPAHTNTVQLPSEETNTAATTLKILLGFLGVGAVALIAYLFVVYA